MRSAVALALAAALLAGCGDSPKRSEGKRLEADLDVTVMPRGPDGPAERRAVECAVLGQKAAEPACRRLGRLTPEALDPVPALTACTQVYGGPGTARVQGTLRGRRVSARFRLTDGCEIARWRRNAELLGAPPSVR
jgi:hypothetical protein